ncbi:hypothetical protein DL768_002124 [Monosporascus sp. mg162]|nr:hypothetical protein DL768_002124 [Monosporascus sp. mg162]
MEAEEPSEDSQRDDTRDKWQDAIRVKPESQKRWDVIKVILRSFTLALAIALVVFCARSVRVYGSFLAPSTSYAFIGCVVPASVSGLWALAEFITVCVRTRRSGLRLTGIPPGAHVAVDLLLWLATLVFMALLSVWFVAALQSPWYYTAMPGGMGVALAALCFQLALAALHFTLFVRACIETERRNSERRIKKAIMSLSQWGLDLASTSNQIIRRSHALSTLPPESVIEEQTNRPPESPKPPDRRRDAQADVEAETRIEDNVKFIMPASVIKEMTVQKYTMMGPADGEQKQYPPGGRQAWKRGINSQEPAFEVHRHRRQENSGQFAGPDRRPLGGLQAPGCEAGRALQARRPHVNLGRLRRARKYDLVLALKLRSPALPEELRLKVCRQRRKAGIVDEGDEEVLRVIEVIVKILLEIDVI